MSNLAATAPRSNTRRRRFTAISLYSGTGGLDIGLKRAGIDTVLANDIDPTAVETYNAHAGAAVAVAGDIRADEIRSRIVGFAGEGIDIVAGGPPCQGFSISGRMDPNDPRSRHVFDFFEVIREVQPRETPRRSSQYESREKRNEPQSGSPKGTESPST